MSSTIRILACGVFFFASWTHAFAIGTHGTIPNLLLAACFSLAGLHWLTSGRALYVDWKSHDIVLLAFLTVTVFAGVLASNSKTVNYLIAYLFSFLALAIAMREVFFRYGASRPFLVANAIGVLFVSAFVIAEFFLNVLLQIDIQDWIVRTTPADALYFIFPRAYGLSEEPTYLAWYYNTLGTVAAASLWATKSINGSVRLLLTVLIATGYCLTFSAAGFVFLVVAAVAAALAELLRRFLVHERRALDLRLIGWAGATGLAILLVAYANWIPDTLPVRDFFGGLVDKITLSQAGPEDRAPRWAADFARALGKPLFGHGPGYLSSVNQGSSLNLFLFVALEQGVIASGLLMLFYLTVGLRIWTSNFRYRLAILVAYIAGVLHFMTMTQHYHPCLWLLIVLAEILRAEARQPSDFRIVRTLAPGPA